MRIKDGLLLCKVGDSSVVMATGSTMHLNGLTTLNETGAFLWSKLSTDTDEDALTAAMCDAFDVDETTAREDVRAFLSMLQKAGFLA